MTVTEKATRHDTTMRVNSIPIVFCVQCGSTCIDQNSLTELRCYSCENTLPWDATKFSIRRGMDGLEDVAQALMAAQRRDEKAAIDAEAATGGFHGTPAEFAEAVDRNERNDWS